MELHYCAQDVVRCTLCKTAEASMYCEVCHLYLCGECVLQHLADKSQLHKVVPIEQFLSTPKCPDHPNKQCELHCEQCDVPICSQCVITKHKNHDIGDLIENCKQKQEVIRRDLEELEKSIYPRYQKTAENIPVHKADLSTNSQTLKSAINKQGQALHNEINTIINGLHSKIDEYDIENLAAINHQEIVINTAIKEIKHVIQDLKSLLDTSDVCLVSKYKSRNEEFNKLPTELHVTLPNFQPQEIIREKLLTQLFGSLYPLSIETEEQGYNPHFPGVESSPPDRPLLDVPRIMTNIAIGYKDLQGVSCLNDEEIWTRGYNDKALSLYNLQGELVKSIQTKSGNYPTDMALTRNGDLVYTDYYDRSINLVSDSQIQTLITLRGWGPLAVCITSSGDILVSIKSDDRKPTKVVRYSGSTEKQSIQWNDQDNPLYSSKLMKYLTENRNGDICVADCGAGAVVVVSAAGKFRFRYTGPPYDTKGQFKPLGITTDSQGHILTSDYNNHRIHIVDQDGHFLRYIDNCNLKRPWGLCVDSRDNLFVADNKTRKVKKILYYK